MKFIGQPEEVEQFDLQSCIDADIANLATFIQQPIFEATLRLGCRWYFIYDIQ